MTSASLAVSLIGQALAQARGLKNKAPQATGFHAQTLENFDFNGLD